MFTFSIWYVKTYLQYTISFSGTFGLYEVTGCVAEHIQVLLLSDLFTVHCTLYDVVFPVVLLLLLPMQSQDNVGSGFPPDTVHVNVTDWPEMIGVDGVLCTMGLLSGASER